MFAAYYHHTRVVRELVFARADLSVCSLNGYVSVRTPRGVCDNFLDDTRVGVPTRPR